MLLSFVMIFRKKENKRIFLDYASITPIAPEVSAVMNKYSKNNFANPSAIYTEGIKAKEAMDSARNTIAHTLGVSSDEIIFTSGGTEANNLALLGIYSYAKKNGITPHIITSSIEHPAILEVCREIEKEGGEITYLPVSEEGIVSTKDILNSLKKNTVLVSIMYANNEIGTVQPIKEINRIIKDWRTSNKTNYPYFHTDACQAGLYLPLNISRLGVDMMTLDAIKLYGPRGIGVLYKKNQLDINPQIFGGGQERGLRSGTENVQAIVGFAEAILLADKMMEKETIRLSKIRDYGIKEIISKFPHSKINGSLDRRLPNNINFCIPGVDSEYLVVALDVNGISASYSSSCRNLLENSSSYVISALGREDCQSSSLRITLGRESKKEDIDILIKKLKKIIR